MRAPAPPYASEGLHALWHVSENPRIARFEPHVSENGGIDRFVPRANEAHDSPEPLVWAIDGEHVPAYWFPRDCPRGTFWAAAETAAADAERLLAGSSRVHVIEEAWLDRMRAATVFAYRLPEERFEPHPEVGGYWISRAAAEPIEIERLDDLVGRHERAEIELRVLANLWPLWNDVAASTLEFSGMRLRYAAPAM